MLDWDNDPLLRRQKSGKGNFADDSATTAAIEAASIKKLAFKPDSLSKVQIDFFCWHHILMSSVLQ